MCIQSRMFEIGHNDLDLCGLAGATSNAHFQNSCAILVILLAIQYL